MRNQNKIKDETGKRFGSLVVQSRGPASGRGYYWRCRCDCGKRVVVLGSHLRSGNTSSCGCQKHPPLQTTHGMSKHSLYIVWVNMQRRCRHMGDPNYDNYGGRGIRVCDRWSGPEGFPHFIADMGERPAGLTLERLDNDGHYEPGNCAWATYKAQANNRRPRKMR